METLSDIQVPMGNAASNAPTLSAHRLGDDREAEQRKDDFRWVRRQVFKLNAFYMRHLFTGES